MKFMMGLVRPRNGLKSFCFCFETVKKQNIFYRQNQYSIDSSEFDFQHKRVAYVTPFANSGEFTYVPFRSNKYYGWYIDDFESFRKIKCIVDQPIDLQKSNHKLKVFNPYPENILLDSLEFNVAYLDAYKDILEIRPLKIAQKNSELKLLKANDTSAFNFTFPEPKKGHPEFIKFSISENGLKSGINSPSIKVEP